ncbi:MerR family transcriptional regulator [Yinghuangia sp. ASG 101]|uniref:helix-turn-helix domain-containing protein n=1 Tax=Yinghuangia sp. ASG 101 TaxID=2896848 RepID=UPI001E65BBFA|nr:MerR family transcriptional regulator [Yinghuangia sp. ASG 101]UGQ12720.1 MerR family transcriptional regulator [Yinghuangia sp. ASG 101]
MAPDTPDDLWSIGELAARAGATVKTVRFYSDAGLLPEAARSGGGHRRYGPDALERLRLIRALRTLDVPLPDIGRVLAEEDALTDAVAGRLRSIGTQLTALRWQEAALRLIQDCPAEERAERLHLIGTVTTPPDTTALARFWRRWLPPRLPARVVSTVLDHTVPQPPDDPTPAQVMAFARLHAFVSRDCASNVPCQPAAHRPDTGYRPAVLYDGLAEAFTLAAPALRADHTPSAGPALDCFVSAYATSLGAPDSPAFRHRLSRELAADPRIDHYWHLTAELSTPTAPTAGAAHTWLREALDAQVGGPADGHGGTGTGTARRLSRAGRRRAA